ncbi:hypothetical protein OSB04_031397 [Centaurea solstitialis]|uniref:Integrase catalytic domain-containing protein n=1 Tax=Centaurea solstitialis TaxID=347529 RepID=A0AA38S8W0_9ASTR|nr:hypothetical protein OSB04_031397 [Centaurea solstitialis]
MDQLTNFTSSSSLDHPSPWLLLLLLMHSLNTLLHMLIIKLSSTNYLLWKNQMLPILSYQNLLCHVDGSTVAPPPLLSQPDGKTIDNPDYISWVTNQKTTIILHASLTEEAVTVIVGLSMARDIWNALEAAFRNSLIERVHNLRDQLRQSHKGSKSVAEYGAYATNFLQSDTRLILMINFTGFFVASGHHLKPFLRLSVLLVLLRLLLICLPGRPSWLLTTHCHFFYCGLTKHSGKGRSLLHSWCWLLWWTRLGRRSPHCQLCRTNGHYASVCPKLASFASQASSKDDALASAFLSQCHVSSFGPDWFVNSGATDHMTASSETISNASSVPGTASVMFGSGHYLPVSHKGHASLSPNLLLKDVLVVPRITKNLLSISKLTKDNHVDVLFSYPDFFIQDRQTQQVLAQGKCDDGLYILQLGAHAFFACPHHLKPLLKLGHVSFDTLVKLQKLGHLSVTSLLPKPDVCLSCKLAKSQRLPFDLNPKRALHPLDLIHCDVWGPSPVFSVDNYRYYVIFVDDFSRFSWLYPLKLKFEIYSALEVFMKFVQTQFSSKINVFQSDGGTEFLNHKVRTLFESNGTLHRVSCPYTPQQNGQAERKHRHVVETGLAMMFNAHLPSSYWVDAFSSAVYIINRLPTSTLQGKSPFELLYSQTPNYHTFRAFGCRVFPYLRDYSENKLSPRSLPCIFIGYSPKYKGYWCLDPVTSRVYISRHASFDETNFPFANCPETQSVSQLQVVTFLDVAPLAKSPTMPTNPPISPSSITPPPSSTTPYHLCTNNSTPLSIPPDNPHSPPPPSPLPPPPSPTPTPLSPPPSPPNSPPSDTINPTPPAPLPTHHMITRG